MPGHDLLVALPAFAIGPMFLVCGQAIHPVPLQNAMHRGTGDQDLMKPMQVRGDSFGTEVILLPQIENLANHVA
jgi:hypothetical protein